MIPKNGKTHAQEAGSSSVSEKLIHSKIAAFSTSVDPLISLLATKTNKTVIHLSTFYVL